MLHSVEVPAALQQPVPKPVRLEYYTDLLCRRSWDFEPHWRRLQAEFVHQFDWRCRLGASLAASLPACLAVKCAERQSDHASELYLRAVREAGLHQRRNIARPEVLAAVANELAAQVPTVFDAATFHRDMAANAGAAAFCEDLQQARSHQISQFPAIMMQRGPEPSRLAVRCQPYEALLHELTRLAPDLFYVASLVEGGAG